MFKVPNQYRVRAGPMGSSDLVGLCGAFEIIIPRTTKHKGRNMKLICIACDGTPSGWQHVSCYKFDGFSRYIPSWENMCHVKSLFWDDEDCVVQYHPAKKDYVNNNPYVLHLWRPVGIEMLRPPKELI